MRRLAVVVAAVLLPASAASAHVEVRPAHAPAGSESRLTFEVPNEREGAATRRIIIQMPRGVTSVAELGARGWQVTPTAAGREVRRVTLTAPPGRELTGEHRGRFRLLVDLPNRKGALLTFKVLQVYDDGEIVRWLGPKGTSEPAPTLRLTAARAAAPRAGQETAQSKTQPSDSSPGSSSGGSSENPAGSTSDGSPSGSSDGSSDKDGDGDGGVPIWAGIGLILLAALAGSTLARRRNRQRLEQYRSEHDE